MDKDELETTGMIGKIIADDDVSMEERLMEILDKIEYNDFPIWKKNEIRNLIEDIKKARKKETEANLSAGIDDFSALEGWIESIDLEQQFLDYAASVVRLAPKQGEWEATKDYMMPQLKALVGRYSRLDDEAFYRFYLPIDETIQAALKNSSLVE